MASDSMVLYEWVNDPLIRQMAFSTAPIPLQDHERWFERVLSDPSNKLFIFEQGGKPLGQIRFMPVVSEEDVLLSGMSGADKAGVRSASDGAPPLIMTVDVHLAPNQRGRGLGSEIISRGSNRVFDETPCVAIKALVKNENQSSQRAFAKSGYHPLPGVLTVQDTECVCMLLTRSSS